MTLNDLECPIHLKVRFTDGMLDVRTLWLSDSTIRIGVASGAEGGGLQGLALLLPPCGQLTRCFSAVAELLVERVVGGRLSAASGDPSETSLLWQRICILIQLFGYT